MSASPLPTAPAADDCQVVELRRYTLYPRLRDALIELFEREFVEPQEAAGMRLLGQFRELDDASRFTWLRGFAGMASRRQALAAFYGGPVWAAHRTAANATMVDSDDVLLLRPAWPGATALGHGERAPPGATAAPPGVVVATLFHLRAHADPALLADCAERLQPTLAATGARVLGWYASETADNDFPRLPVRADARVLVALALYDDAAAPRSPNAALGWARDVAPALAGRLERPPEALRLAPTARSALHG